MLSEHSLRLLFQETFEASISLKQRVINDHLDSMLAVTKDIIGTFANKKKVLLCGNGGSAADAQHIAAEWVTRYHMNRRALPALALTVNTSDLTAIGNDFDFTQIFSRQIEAHGDKGDLLIALSTSGKSKNIIKAVKKARELGIRCIGLTGNDGGELGALSDIALIVPSENTARIQEIHSIFMHAVCEAVDLSLFSDKK